MLQNTTACRYSACRVNAIYRGQLYRRLNYCARLNALVRIRAVAYVVNGCQDRSTHKIGMHTLACVE
jgi:hypothetical protein